MKRCMRIHSLPAVLLALPAIGLVASPAPAQEAGTEGAGYARASERLQGRLETSLERLTELRETIADEKLPLVRRLNELEDELGTRRDTFRERSRELDRQTLDLSNLKREIESREKEVAYLGNLLGEYRRNFESRLHLAEMSRYREAIEAAQEASEDEAMGDRRALATQVSLVGRSVDRLLESVGGTRFEGEAVVPGGELKPGRFLLLGPMALFGAGDGTVAGTAVREIGSSRPTVRPFQDEASAAAARQAVAGNGDRIPVDPTLGKAHKIEATRTTLVEHMKKGGPVMVPILGLAALSLLVALYKWLALTLHRKPSPKRLRKLLETVAARKPRPAIMAQARSVQGPAGRMLVAGVEHMDEPRELIEEVMYERVLDAKLKLNRLLPFVAITAASAPLLGLLGTVTGIINTFELITAFGTGDAQTLSGGISEALVTTEFGLIVAIPSLLIHAFLSRKAKSITDAMEKAAMTFLNEIPHDPARGAPDASRSKSDPDPEPESDTGSDAEPDPEPQSAGSSGGPEAVPV